MAGLFGNQMCDQKGKASGSTRVSSINNSSPESKEKATAASRRDSCRQLFSLRK
jgi:hypothetical protein